MSSPTADILPLPLTEASQRLRLQSMLLCKLAVHICRTSVQLRDTAMEIMQTSGDVQADRPKGHRVS